MKKYFKYLVRGIATLLAIFLVLYLIAYIYVSANKKTIIAKVTHQISEKLNGNVSIGNVDLSFFSTFPQISVLVEKVTIKDTLYSVHKHPFFTADKVFARLSILNLIARKDPLNGVRIDDGNFYLFTDTSGYTNEYLLKPKAGDTITNKGNANKIFLEDIKLNNFNVTVQDLGVNKFLEFNVEKLNCAIKQEDSTLRFRTKNKIFIKSLAFNLDKGSYAKGKTFTGNFDLFYNATSNTLSFNDIDLKLNKQAFNFSGKFVFSANPFFNLVIDTKKLEVAEGRSLLPEKIARAVAIVSLDEPIDVKAVMTGPLTIGDPLVKVDWVAAEKTKITSPFFVLDNCTFTGGFTNEFIPGLPRLDPNSRLRIHNLVGEYEGIPIRSENIFIDNLEVPMINMDVKSNFPLNTLNKLLQNNSLQLNEGNAALDITYSGPLTKNSNANTFMNGSLNISDGLLLYAPRNVALKNCNGSIVFNNTDVMVKDLRTNVQGNDIIMNGSVKNLLSLIKTNPGKISLNWNIYSPELNLATLTSLLKKRSKVTVNTNKKFGSTTRQIDDMLEQSNVVLDLKADKLNYKKFTATNVKASINLVQDSWTMNNISLQSGGGAMQIKGYVKQNDDQTHEIKVNVNIDNADVNKVMYSFNDFGQDGISYKNLQGKLSSEIDMKMKIDRELAGTPTNMEGYVNFSLKKGALINYEPIKKLQNFLFKNRNFDDIKFAELKDRFDIKNGDFTINRMEIQSTALSLFLEGIYSMKGNTDISIQVPLSNLKKRDDDYKPKNKGADAKGGTSIYVRGRPGDDGSIKFKYDLFRKFRKDVKEKKEDEKAAAKEEKKTSTD